MPASRRAVARFTEAEPVRRESGAGLVLRFRPEAARLGVDRIEDFADLGPALTVPAVTGLGKVLRILRAARIALPVAPLELVGREERAASLLARAVGTPVRLALRPRFEVRCQVWTDRGVETVGDVDEVIETDDAYLIRRRRGRLPLRIERSAVIRQVTRTERWHEILEIERA